MEAYKDYMIILSPSVNIAEQVKKFKLSSQRLIGDFEGIHSRAHITMKLLKRQKPFHTEPLFKQIEKELSLLEPGILQLNGFATFLPTDYTTIYAAIKSTPVMEDWFKRLRKSLSEKKSVPHITIARQVSNEKAKKLWPKFKDRKWNEEFEVKRLTILHRETFGYEKIWRPFTEIPFRGNPEWNKLPEKTVKTHKDVDVNQISLF
ncbi:MAG TPA: 2'-5' RNA ligase family protein [Mucilaginibacter sp.]|jgi:2'-5' RNA ligase